MRAALGMVMTDASVTNVSITNVCITNILSLTEQDKRRLRQDVLAEYSAWVDEVSEDCDFKTEFSKEDLVYKTTDIVIEKLLCLKK